MNTASGIPLLNPSTVSKQHIHDAEGKLEEIEHIVQVGYHLSYSNIYERVKEIVPRWEWSPPPVKRAFVVVLQRNLARGYYWSDRMVWECLRLSVPMFKDFIRPHLLILGTPEKETRLYNIEVKRDASVLVHGYLLQAGRGLGVVLPYTVRHHIQKFIFYWKTPDVKYKPSWEVSIESSFLHSMLSVLAESQQQNVNTTIENTMFLLAGAIDNNIATTTSNNSNTSNNNNTEILLPITEQLQDPDHNLQS